MQHNQSLEPTCCPSLAVRTLMQMEGCLMVQAAKGWPARGSAQSLEPQQMADETKDAIKDVKGASLITTMRLRHSAFEGNPELLTCVFYGFTMSLVRSSASRIYVVALDEEESADLAKMAAALPPLLASRVKVVDPDQKVLRTLGSVIRPLYEEAAFLWKKEYPGDSNAPFPRHEHTVCTLYELMYLLVLGHMYGAEMDFDPTQARHCLSRLQKQLRSSETCASLARIEGIVRAYEESAEVASLIPLPDSQELRTGELLRDLLEDARWTYVSTARYHIGVLGKLRRACSEINRRLRDLLRDPAKQKYLSLGRQLVTAAAEKVPVPIPVPESLGKTKQGSSPPLHSLAGLKPYCIGTMRWFPFSPAEVGTDRYLNPEPKRCPVRFLFRDEEQKKADDIPGSNKAVDSDEK
jgi:hypothetical protein